MVNLFFICSRFASRTSMCNHFCSMGTIMKFVINMEGLDADLEFCSMGTIMKFVINMEGLDADLERI
jgi:hypothetical protein